MNASPISRLTITSAPGNHASGEVTTLASGLTVEGPIYCGSSELYFSDPDHTSSPVLISGWAGIQNAKDLDALWISGRTRDNGRRHVRVSDDLEVTGNLTVRGQVTLSGSMRAEGSVSLDRGLSVEGGPIQLSATPGTPIQVTGELIASDQLSAPRAQLADIRFSHGWSAFPDGRTDGAEISNDTSAYKTLMIVGNRSAGDVRRVSVWDRLDVHGALLVDGPFDVAADVHVGGLVEVLGSSNPILFSSGWSGFPDGRNNGAEISNDTGAYKTLMIVGNKSAGDVRRVSVWDRLDVNGHLSVSGDAALGSAKIAELGFGTQQHGPVRYPYETIQMNPAHNLRLWYGSTERFVFSGTGELIIRLNRGYWVFQDDGNLVKYRNDGTALWALNKVSSNWQW